jgi:transcription elongation factor GreA
MNRAISQIGQGMRLSDSSYNRISDEIKFLMNVRVPEVRAMVVASKGAGDNSQNTDYFSAAEEESRVLAELARLQSVLDSHELAVVAGHEMPDASTVVCGVIVTIAFSEGDREDYLIGSIEESRSSLAAVVTPESPLGSALMGRRVGEEVCWSMPNGQEAKAELVGIRLPD